MKKSIIALALLAAAALAAYLYVTRAPSAPSQDVTVGNATTSAASGSYAIVPGESLARFEIGEVLRGAQFTAVGTTSQVSGTVSVVDGGLSFGEIRVNARTFKTDDARRDGAIARAILRSEDAANEFIVFSPKTVTNNHALTASSSTYTVNGDLTIAGVTKPATFTVQAALVDGQVVGTARATLSRKDFSLAIPSLSFIASVEDEFAVSAAIVAR